jgi:hypothetical protein
MYTCYSYGDTKIGIGSIFASSKSNFDINSSKTIHSYKEPDKTHYSSAMIGEIVSSKILKNGSVKGGFGFTDELKGLFLKYSSKIKNF